VDGLREWDCETCKKPPMYGLMDGYSFGERLLEDVMFECMLYDDNCWVIQVEKAAEPYFEQLNQTMWMTAAYKYCNQNDVWECPGCGGDIAPKEQ
jgi:hypothetical protein